MMSLHSNEKIISFDDTMASQYLPEENHFQQDADVPPETTHNSPKSIASQFSFVNEKHDEEKVLPILIGNLKSNHPTRDEIMDPQVISATFEDSDFQLQEQNLNNSIPHYSETKSSSKVNMSESSFEEQCAREWKAREEFEHEQRQQLEKYLKESRELFTAEMEIKMCEHQTKIIRQDLLLRRQRLEQQRKKELEARHLEQLNNSVMSHDDFTEDVEPDEQLTASRIDVHNKKMCNKLQRSNGIIDEDQVIEKYNVPNNEPTINDRNSSSLNDQALSFNSQTLQQTIQNIYNSVMNSDTEFNEGVSSNRMEVDEEPANEQAGSSNQGGQVSKPYKCQHCPKQYQHRCNLITHTKIHDENKRIKCEICFKLFANTSQYRAHMNSHTGEKLHFCSVCNRGFRHRDYLMKHEKIHLRKFKSRQSGDMVAYGERKMECFQCKKKFSHIATLIRHENIHKNIRPYQCNYCGKRFTQSGNLNTHVRIHTGEKPFKCQYCGKGFARRDNTKIHMQRCEFREDINHINHSFPALSNSPQSSSDLVIDEC